MGGNNDGEVEVNLEDISGADMFYCYGFAATSQLPVVLAGYLPLEDRMIAPDSGTLCDRYEPVRTYRPGS